MGCHGRRVRPIEFAKATAQIVCEGWRNDADDQRGKDGPPQVGQRCLRKGNTTLKPDREEQVDGERGIKTIWKL